MDSLQTCTKSNFAIANCFCGCPRDLRVRDKSIQVFDSKFQVTGSIQWSFHTCQTQSKNTMGFDRKLPQLSDNNGIS